MNSYLGIDFGTSGARAIVIEKEQKIVSEVFYNYDDLALKNWRDRWEKALFSLIEQIPTEIRRNLKAIAINGTSSTVLLCDGKGKPIDNPIWYNDDRGAEILETLKAIVPPNHVVLSPTSSLGKLLWWYRRPVYSQASYFLHQADWLASLLHGKLGISDYHNALKLGYDVEKLCYPDWIEKLPLRAILPQVLAPGTPVGEVKKEISDRYFLPRNCLVCTGTTDSIAAFLASGVQNPGDAVTSLGSTLVLKLLSHKRVEDAKYGIYSHRLGALWLTGGASNTGGAVLRKYFSDRELVNLSQQIEANTESPLDYYPLLNKGERFPINDPQLSPRLEPRPNNSVQFLHGLLESMARIEAKGYQLLQQLGATPLRQVYTAGGGAQNSAWRIIRQRNLKVPVIKSTQTAAAYGSALLALRSLREPLRDARGEKTP